MLITGPQGIIETANPRSESLFGYSAAKLTGQPVEILVPKRLRDVHRLHHIGYASHPVNRSAGEGLTLFGAHKNGREFPIDVSLSPLQGATELRVLVVIYDVSKYRQTETALRDSEERFSTLFNSAADCLFIFDLGGAIRDVNFAACDRLGYTRSEMLSINIIQTKSTEFAARLPNQLAQVTKNGNALFESANRHKNGTIIPVEVNSTIIKVGGEKNDFQRGARYFRA